ncbi:MAG: substrate-binding domain-containing protein [Clostridia bacterium]|nr:substrate-binding domain-containing protein [Clostridia bacterium]
MVVPIIYEPYYSKDSIWCAGIRSGIEKALTRKKYFPVYIDGDSYRSFDYDKLFKDTPRLLILVANRCSWILSALDFFEKNKIDILLVDCCPFINNSVKGQVFFHYEHGIATALEHLSKCGCSRTALYGLFRNSFADKMKQRAFEEKMRCRGIDNVGSLCFDNDNGLADCYDKFHSRISEFDSVICTNEIAANSLIKRLLADGIRVPEQLQIVSYGYTKLTDISNPSITTLKFDNCELGQQIVMAFRYLYNSSPDTTHLTIRISGKLIQRGSTRRQSDTASVSMTRADSLDTVTLNFYDDEEVTAFSRIEKLLLACDDIDVKLLLGLLENMPYERISDGLHLSRSTVFYRIHRLEEAIDITSLNDFKEFLITHHFKDILENYIDD